MSDAHPTEPAVPAAKPRFWQRPEFKQLLLWCLPALLVGGFVRALLIVHFPYGYVQADTTDFLVTTERLLVHHSLVLHGKKAFLAPILFTLPFLVKIPALLIIPVAQHLLGLILTVLAGALTREWMKHWRWFIIPATLLTTLNPALIWYEHALLAEAHYIFCAAALALVGTLLTLQPTNARFIWLLVALFLTGGSRPEGKLFVVFGLALVTLVYWGQGKKWAAKIGITMVASALIWMSSRSSQAGLLLYATVLPLAPEVSKVAPDFSPVIKPLRDQYIAEGPTVRRNLTTSEKAISKVVHEYADAKNDKSIEPGSFCQKLAVEAVLNKPLLLPAIAFNKFLMSCKSSTSGGFNEYWVQKKQSASYLRKTWLFELMHGLTGKNLTTREEVIAFIQQHYPPLEPDWFAGLQKKWNQVTLQFRFPDRHYQTSKVRGLSYFFAISFLGMIAALRSPGRLWRFHFSWLLALGGVWFIVLLTGVSNPRYRFVFEPFCVLYALFLLDAVWRGIEWLFSRLKPRATAS